MRIAILALIVVLLFCAACGTMPLAADKQQVETVQVSPAETIIITAVLIIAGLFVGYSLG